ncbi:MAG: hypothetical protein AL399_04485 [Candidatus [Bacteroides] periocalifornicus]|uniref:Diadenylate cyclase n=1 Tax=Candidatus [Bacteroides] periocalifornicus TaxID=1702214 RepID=A0A0Q4B7W7_9BACT|nr:MAG: hypothetical protein AL399_04485 [Candidatus [Bacteroides] periocalifornicus]
MESQTIISLGILDVVDILLVAYLLYRLYAMIRGTTAMAIFIGISVVYAFWLVVRALNMELTGAILGQVMGVGMIALIIVFQQEIRRFLLYMGTRYLERRHMPFSRFFAKSRRQFSSPIIAEIVAAATQMGREKVGALIVLTRHNGLQEIVEKGVQIDANVKARLLENIFFKNSPLHDGAAVLSHERIAAAQCILPVSQNPAIPRRLGLRHRAAIGLTEESDALVLVVSEETGAISLVEDGEITEGYNATSLTADLQQRLAV